jgi:hypothetical protein
MLAIHVGGECTIVDPPARESTAIAGETREASPEGHSKNRNCAA